MIKKVFTGVLAICSVLLYGLGFAICEYFYPDIKDINQWRLLRDTLYGVCIFIFSLLAFLPKTSFLKSMMIICIFLCCGNLSDRLIFGITGYHWSDKPLIIAAIIAATITYIYDVKRKLG
mgnify:CR=1 FL=1